MKRNEILEAARKCVCEDREEQYGTPEDNFGVIASMWEAYLRTGKCVSRPCDIEIQADDVAMMMALVKMARIITAPQPLTPSPDSFVDLCGYAALAGEILTE